MAASFARQFTTFLAVDLPRSSALTSERLIRSSETVFEGTIFKVVETRGSSFRAARVDHLPPRRLRTSKSLLGLVLPPRSSFPSSLPIFGVHYDGGSSGGLRQRKSTFHPSRPRESSVASESTSSLLFSSADFDRSLSVPSHQMSYKRRVSKSRVQTLLEPNTLYISSRTVDFQDRSLLALFKPPSLHQPPHHQVLHHGRYLPPSRDAQPDYVPNRSPQPGRRQCEDAHRRTRHEIHPFLHHSLYKTRSSHIGGSKVLSHPPGHGIRSQQMPFRTRRDATKADHVQARFDFLRRNRGR